MPTIWNCPGCERETYKELVSCPHCKIKFNAPWRCGSCGSDNQASVFKCSNCGLSIKEASPLQETTETSQERKDPLSFFGPEHDFAMLQTLKNQEVEKANRKETLIRKIKNSMKNIALLIFAFFTIFFLFEVILREFPRFMPYAKQWNYLHHYEDLSRLFRGVHPHDLKNPKIITIGDSFTRGAEVAPGKDWVARLEKDFGYNILNLAVGGSSSVEQWVILKELIIPKSVKNVVFVIYRNDIDQNFSDLILHENKGDAPFIKRAKISSDIGISDNCKSVGWYTQGRCWYYRSYFLSSIYDIYRQWTIGESFQRIVNVKKTKLIFDPISKLYISREATFSEFKNQETWFKLNSEGVAATLLVLKKVKELLFKKNISLKVVYLPSVKEVYYSDWAKELNIDTAPNISAGAILGPHILDLNLPFKNLAPSLRKIRISKAPLFIPLDGHPSEKGHKTIAKLIGKFLKNHKIK